MVSVIPADVSTNIPINTAIAIQFSEPLLPESISKDTVRVIGAAVPIAGTIALAEDCRSLVFRPETALASLANFKVEISGVRDRAGNRLEAPVASHFETSDAVDVTPPLVRGLDMGMVVALQFSEPIDPTTITVKSIRLNDVTSGAVVAATSVVGATGNVIYLIPSAPLKDGAAYCLTVDCVADLAGNCLDFEIPTCFTPTE